MSLLQNETCASALTKGVRLPDWFRELQVLASERYQALAWPRKKDENWRFASSHGVDIEEFRAGEPVLATVGEALVRRSDLLGEVTGKLVFANEICLANSFPKTAGVICCPLAEAVEKHAQLLQEHFMSQDAVLGSEKLAALHKSQTRSGLFLYVPSGVELESPIAIYHWVSGAKARIFPHTLVVTGHHAKVAVVDYYLSADQEAGYSTAVVDLVAGNGSEILYAAAQDLNASSRNVQIINTLAHANARIQSLLLQLGSQWTRSEGVTHLLGKGADSQMFSASLATQGQEMDQRTWQHHAEPHTTSDLLYKNVLYGNGRSIFAGLIRVDEGAYFTDAYQKCRNLLMSEEAEANSMPGLEINADQVKCSHGATTGQIDPEQVFYFNARGIPTASAKQLIAAGFLEDAVDRLRHEGIRTAMKRMIEAKFSQIDDQH